MYSRKWSWPLWFKMAIRCKSVVLAIQLPIMYSDLRFLFLAVPKKRLLDFKSDIYKDWGKIDICQRIKSAYMWRSLSLFGANRCDKLVAKTAAKDANPPDNIETESIKWELSAWPNRTIRCLCLIFILRSTCITLDILSCKFAQR